MIDLIFTAYVTYAQLWYYQYVEKIKNFRSMIVNVITLIAGREAFMTHLQSIHSVWKLKRQSNEAIVFS